MAKFVKGDVVVVPFPFSDLTQANAVTGNSMQPSGRSKFEKAPVYSVPWRADGRSRRKLIQSGSIGAFFSEI